MPIGSRPTAVTCVHITRKEEICLSLFQTAAVGVLSRVQTTCYCTLSPIASAAELLVGPSAFLRLLLSNGLVAVGTGITVEMRLQRVRFPSSVVATAGCANSHCNSNGNNSVISTRSLVLADTFFRVREPAILPATLLLLRLPHQGACRSLVSRTYVCTQDSMMTTATRQPFHVQIMACIQKWEGGGRLTFPKGTQRWGKVVVFLCGM